jgi:hypothetical protein
MSLQNKTATVTGRAAAERLGTAEEIAQTALYRVRPSAEFVIGLAVAMEGGLGI